MTDKTFTIDDMIATAIEAKPDTFKDAFNSVMAQKAAGVVLAKREELAKTIFSSAEEQETDEAPEEGETLDLEAADDDQDPTDTETEDEDVNQS